MEVMRVPHSIQLREDLPHAPLYVTPEAFSIDTDSLETIEVYSCAIGQLSSFFPSKHSNKCCMKHSHHCGKDHCRQIRLNEMKAFRNGS